MGKGKDSITALNILKFGIKKLQVKYMNESWFKFCQTFYTPPHTPPFPLCQKSSMFKSLKID